MTREQFDARSLAARRICWSAPRSEVADKILAQHELFRHDRFLAQMSLGPLPHERVMRSIELLGTEVVPLVREGLAAAEAA